MGLINKKPRRRNANRAARISLVEEPRDQRPESAGDIDRATFEAHLQSPAVQKELAAARSLAETLFPGETARR